MTRKPGKGSRKLAALELADEDDLLLGRKRPSVPDVSADNSLGLVEPVARPEMVAVEGDSAGLQLRKKPSRRKDSFFLNEATVERLRNATGWFQSQGYSVTKGDIAEAALVAYLAKLESEHHGGTLFPKLRRALKQGVV